MFETRVKAFIQIHFWDQSHITIVWNTRETGEIHATCRWQHEKFNSTLTKKSQKSSIFCQNLLSSRHGKSVQIQVCAHSITKNSK